MNKSLTDRPKSGGALRNVENRSDSGGSSAIANSVPDRAANSLLLETRNLQEMPLSIETAVKFGLATRLPTRFMAHSLLIRIDKSRAAALLGVRYAMAFRKAGRPLLPTLDSPQNIADAQHASTRRAHAIPSSTCCDTEKNETLGSSVSPEGRSRS